MESRLKKELFEKYKAQRDEKVWFYTTVGLIILAVVYFGGHALLYWITH